MIRGQAKGGNALKAKVKEKLCYYEIAPEELAAALRMSRGTYYNKLREPSKFTVGEIQKMRKKLSITDEELLLIMKG